MNVKLHNYNTVCLYKPPYQRVRKPALRQYTRVNKMLFRNKKYGQIERIKYSNYEKIRVKNAIDANNH